MGLLSTYVAYRIGKRSGRKKEQNREQQTYSPMSAQCIHYDYCSARGGCLELTECEYE